MTSIMVSVMPFAGHVAPCAAVVSELVARGHRVRVYTGSRYVGRFSALGAEASAWKSAPDFDERNLQATFPEVGKPGLGVLKNLEHLFLRSAVGQATDLLALHAEEPYDLLVGDVMSMGTQLAAEKLDLPWATLSIVPLMSNDPRLPPAGLALHPGVGGIGAVRDAVLRGMSRLFMGTLEKVHREVRAELGLPPQRHRIDSAWYSPWLVVATGSPSIEYPRSELGKQFHFVGRLAAPNATPPEFPAWWSDVTAASGPVVLITQGTYNTDPTELIRPALDAFAPEPVLALVTTGHRGNDELPFPVPGNARVAGLLPFAELLPLTDAMVTNGGWGGVLEAVAHGIPLIVAGGDLDKPEIAARVSWAGLGIDLGTGTPRPVAITRAYARLCSDPGYAERARAAAHEFEALGGTKTAADLIERLAAERAPVTLGD